MDDESQNPAPTSRGPEDTLRDGRLKASIWKNDSEKGHFHSTTLARTYEDRDGNLKDSHSFATGDLLRVSELARGAYTRSRELDREHAQERRPEQDRQAADDRRDQGRDNRRDEFREQRRDTESHRSRERSPDRSR